MNKNKKTPGIALTDKITSAKCCHLFKVVGEIREDGNVITATAFEDLTMLFKDLMKPSTSHSYRTNVNRITGPRKTRQFIIIISPIYKHM